MKISKPITIGSQTALHIEDANKVLNEHVFYDPTRMDILPCRTVQAYEISDEIELLG